MCRIAGMVQAGLPISAIQEIVQKMCDLQKHGGPDDEGIYVSADDHLVLGNRRLALIDLSPDGHMPMAFNNRYFITYNGELYNFPSLKEELVLLGHSFKSHTDTEVILAAFSQWRTQSFAKLKGMFAFGLWDNLEKELYLVRDGAGIKPLYYANIKGSVVFASEMRAFDVVTDHKTANTNWPVYLMAYGHIPEPVTTLSNVKPLHKGCFIKYKIKNGEASLQSFAHYSYTHELDEHIEVNRLIRNAIDDSVKRHLLADAPIGVFLSGGLDSGIIAALAAKYKKTDLNTLSIYFDDAGYSEKKYQDLLQQQLNCNHHPYLLEERSFHQAFPEILRSMDMPSCDGINTWFISKYAASQGLKAVLSGVGGDELFGGYPSFKRIGIAKAIQQMPGMITTMGKRSHSKKLNRMAYLNLEGIKGIYLFLRGHFSPYEIAKHLGAYEKDVWTTLRDQPFLSDISNLENKNQASWMEFNLYMQNQLLRDSDVMSMIHSVEIRVPFLYDDIIKLAFRIKPDIKYNGNLPKQILVDCFNDVLPREIWDRPKMGFSFPFQKWLRNNEFVKEIMAGGNKKFKESYNNYLNDKLHWSHLMSLVLITNHKHQLL